VAYQLESAKLLCAGGRPYNEDYGNYLLLSNYGCWVLADGLGGHVGGEVAARAAAETALDTFASQPGMSAEHLEKYLLAANCAVINAQSKDPLFANMRTTLTILVSDYQSAVWAHIGDTRLYYFQQGLLEGNRPATKDHSVPQAMADAGDITPEDIRFHEDRNRLLRAMGNPNDFRPVVAQPIELNAGDSFLLCTDGFWEYVNELDMTLELRRAAGAEEWLAAMKEQLERQIADKKITGNDNYSAIAVMIRS
jgi:PPM family protein phosphatase